MRMAQYAPELYTFQYKPGAVHKVDAEVVGKVCSELDAKDQLTPENLVDVSRPEDAPVHDEFEWDDSIAAEGFRRHQAAMLIRQVVLVAKPEERKKAEKEDNVELIAYDGVRAFSSDYESGGEKKRYVSTPRIMSDIDKRQILLENAKRDLVAYVRKYEKLSEISGFINEAKKLIEKWGVESQ